MKSLTIFLLILFLGCNTGTKKQSAENSKNENTVETSASTTSSGNFQNKSDSILQKDVNTVIGDIEYNFEKIPSDIKYPGTIVESVKWTDRLGTNLVFISETDEKWNGDLRSKELYAYHYLINENNSKLLWKIYDFIKDCPVDIILSYIPKSFSVTDLDKNEIAETGFLYKLSCKGDVSADDLKLIMHEGDKKYAIRGSMNLLMNGQTLEKGTMKADPLFNTAPDEFLEFATSQWKKFETEKTGE